MSTRTSALVLLVLAACSPRPSDFTGGPATSSSTSAAASSDAADPTTGAGTTGTTGTTGAEATSTGDSSPETYFDHPLPYGCEPFLDDCPEGQKCAAVGEGYPSVACVPVVRDPAGLYEPHVRQDMLQWTCPNEHSPRSMPRRTCPIRHDARGVPPGR